MVGILLLARVLRAAVIGYAYIIRGGRDKADFGTVSSLAWETPWASSGN
jgi:hypothetical protein